MRDLKETVILHPTPGGRLLGHLLFWMGLFALRFYLTRITFNVYSGFPSTIHLLLNLYSTVLIAAVYYLLVYRLWPLAAIQTKYVKATAAVVLLLLCYTIVDALLERGILFSCGECLLRLRHDQPAYARLVYSNLSNIVLKRLLTFGVPFSLILALCIPLFVKMTLNAYRHSIRSLQLTRENLELEFNFLKAQLNPHFLFNTLNNIYGLILRGDMERSGALVARLSELLRYNLYEANELYMPLLREINLMQDYVELEKVRLNHTTVTFDCQTDRDDYRIAPLLMMPLIENAFKFGTDTPGARTSISLKVVNGVFHFGISNRSSPHRASAPGGIGLKNLRKRMEMYYAGRYTYDMAEQDDTYSVTLTLSLA